MRSRPCPGAAPAVIAALARPACGGLRRFLPGRVGEDVRRGRDCRGRRTGLPLAAQAAGGAFIHHRLPDPFIGPRVALVGGPLFCGPLLGLLLHPLLFGLALLLSPISRLFLSPLFLSPLFLSPLLLGSLRIVVRIVRVVLI
jgi:hypothetical protein